MDSLEAPKKPIVLIVSSGFWNPGFYPRFLLNRTLFTHKQFRFSGVPSVEKFPDLLMEKIAAVVLFIHALKISPEALDCLDRYVREGGGLIALMPALTSFEESQVYSEITGARGMASERLETFLVTPSQSHDPIFSAGTDFTIRERLPTLRLNPASVVHFSIKADDGTLPFLWTRTYGLGRICGIAASGAASSFRNLHLQNLISQSLTWCSNKTDELSQNHADKK